MKQVQGRVEFHLVKHAKAFAEAVSGQGWESLQNVQQVSKVVTFDVDVAQVESRPYFKEDGGWTGWFRDVAESAGFYGSTQSRKAKLYGTVDGVERGAWVCPFSW